MAELAVDPGALGEGQWLIVMRQADDAALLDGPVHGFRLTRWSGSRPR